MYIYTTGVMSSQHDIILTWVMTAWLSINFSRKDGEYISKLTLGTGKTCIH
jgi:hypothetical protein